mmetsp:Transcript_9091/g.18143  ORF Transcript_9091/g.18143 Transcript_9091/m.18143 type:complete len:133 (+) Transcript_9091:22-420(+)
MFGDIAHVQSLFHTSWPGTAIGDSGAESGNNGLMWNYGQNFGGPTGDFATGADTLHSGGVGMFGSMGVDAPFNFPTSAHPCDHLAQYEEGYGAEARAETGMGVVDLCKSEAMMPMSEFIQFAHNYAAENPAS